MGERGRKREQEGGCESICKRTKRNLLEYEFRLTGLIVEDRGKAKRIDRREYEFQLFCPRHSHRRRHRKDRLDSISSSSANFLRCMRYRRIGGEEGHAEKRTMIKGKRKRPKSYRFYFPFPFQLELNDFNKIRPTIDWLVSIPLTFEFCGNDVSLIGKIFKSFNSSRISLHQPSRVASTREDSLRLNIFLLVDRQVSIV